jgi:hypothetical protein
MNEIIIICVLLLATGAHFTVTMNFDYRFDLHVAFDEARDLRKEKVIVASREHKSVTGRRTKSPTPYRHQHHDNAYYLWIVTTLALGLGLVTLHQVLGGVQVGLDYHQRNMASFEPPNQSSVISEKNETTRTWSTTVGGNNNDEKVKILLFITTLYSKQHVNYFHCCWPKLVEQSQLFQHAHIIIFSNNDTACT